MKNAMKRCAALLMALILLMGCMPMAVAEEQTAAAPFEVLKKNSRGPEVLRLKQRLYELGYFKTDDLNEYYNTSTVNGIKKFQKRNGLKADGIFTEEVAAVFYSENAIGANDPTPTPSPAPTPDPNAPFEVLKKNSRGPEVLRLKQRLYELGYFRSDDLNDRYNDATVNAIKKFQKRSGLKADGVFTEETANAFYAEDAIPAVTPTPVPTPTPTPEPAPTPRPTPVVDYPERDEEGYLAGEGEYWYENDEDGMWIYLTSSLQIHIVKQVDESVPLEWYETDIRMREGESFMSVETNPARPGTRFKYPFDIAVDNQFVLGFTDDFYGHRINRKETVGVVIRDGEVISSKTYKKQLHNLPNLDILAQFPDGRLKAYGSADITADELVEMGVVNVFCFGPVLISEGEISPLLKWYQTKSPRQALGMIEPGHYLLLSVLGRMKSSEGCGLPFMAQLLKERGVVEALNLDGGNTVALIFRGRMLNKLATWENKKFVRTVTSLIGVGKSEAVTTPQMGAR